MSKQAHALIPYSRTEATYFRNLFSDSKTRIYVADDFPFFSFIPSDSEDADSFGNGFTALYETVTYAFPTVATEDEANRLLNRFLSGESPNSILSEYPDSFSE